MNPSFTHIDEKGQAIMVDVSQKQDTVRTAAASGRISMSRECYDAVVHGDVAKGDVLGTARIGGIMAVKQTSQLIPLCHVLNITKCGIDFTFHEEDHEIEAICTVRCTGQTGVEMEALTGASIALLTIYDMCKAIDRTMCIGAVHVLEKRGGKSGDFFYDEKDRTT
ncbi:cyclic pyranopterin monophosphate synthase MoaC [uncultured Megasphaera sp.]|uniref:cyclic pyranopterin monophosphate synthase MoaC n=1 Tax=uncultured Megasphaera sp. TaxID=165188 RepID=UPI00265AC527|nr:cyclic pyranopterin monophosphate synthase MoaC [uncultured Megasphaera sp.]